MTEKNCRNCKWARWAMTNHTPPRINPHQVGRCGYVVPVPVLPATFFDPATIERSLVNRTGIWANRPHENCRTWEAKEGEK